jgi:hypothetical protein
MGPHDCPIFGHHDTTGGVSISTTTTNTSIGDTTCTLLAAERAHLRDAPGFDMIDPLLAS